MIEEKYITRFWSRVDKRGENECWNWLGGTNGRDYGEIWTVQNKHYRVHRFSYVLHYGIEPGKLLVCHECDNPLCVNPKHLFLGTHLDNVKDCVSKGRFKKRILSYDDAYAIKYSSLSAAELSEKYKVTKGTVLDIRCGSAWKQLP
jgi:hypothetical protein